MAMIRQTIETLKIGGGIMGAKYSLENLTLQDIYESAISFNPDPGALTYAGLATIENIPQDDMLLGFGLAVMSNIMAGIIMEEYGSITDMIKGKKKEGPFPEHRYLEYRKH